MVGVTGGTVAAVFPRRSVVLPPMFSMAACRHASDRGCPLRRRASGANSGHGPPFASLRPPLSRAGPSDLLPPKTAAALGPSLVATLSALPKRSSVRFAHMRYRLPWPVVLPSGFLSGHFPSRFRAGTPLLQWGTLAKSRAMSPRFAPVAPFVAGGLRELRTLRPVSSSTSSVFLPRASL